MSMPEHEKLRRELETAASSLRTVTLRRRIVTGRNAVVGLLLGALVTTLVLVAVGTEEPDAAAPPTAPGDAALTPQTPRRTSARAPASSTAPEIPPRPEPPPDAEQPTLHTVRPGETLARIALRYAVPLEQIADDNAIADPNRIQAGDSVVIRPVSPGVEVIQPGATLGEYAQRHDLTVEALLALNPQITDPDRIVAGGRLRMS